MSYTPPEPKKTDNVIDSRDILQWIAEYQARDEIANDAGTPRDEREPLDEDERERYEALLALAEEAEGSPDWQYGEMLIHDAYFEDYARELAQEIGAINPDAGWPAGYIDWEAAADALRMDYFSVEFAGETYWIRA